MSGVSNSPARDALAASASAENGCKGDGILLPVKRKDILDLKEGLEYTVRLGPKPCERRLVGRDIKCETDESARK